MNSDVTYLAQEIGRMIGASELQLKALATSKSQSRTFLVETRDQKFVAKINDSSQALACVEHNLQRLGALGIPVPQVVAYDGSLQSVSCALLVMTHIDGQDLFFELDGMSRTEMTALAEQIVGFQNAASNLPVLGQCGFACVDQPADRSWADVVRKPNAWSWADPLPEDVAPLWHRLQYVLDAAQPLFNGIEPVCFLDDLTTKNVMMKDGALAGVVDFDVVAYGDPVFHLGLVGAAVHADLTQSAHFYVDELVRLSALDEMQQRMRCLYEANFLINFLGAESPNEPGEWRARATHYAGLQLSATEEWI